MADDDDGTRSAADRLDALERDAISLREHRTRINTLVAGVGVILSASLGAIASSAIATRDATLAHSARLDALDAHVGVIETRDERRSTDDRTTREQLVEIRADVRAVREQLDTLTQTHAHERPR